MQLLADASSSCFPVPRFPEVQHQQLCYYKNKLCWKQRFLTTKKKKEKLKVYEAKMWWRYYSVIWEWCINLSAGSKVTSAILFLVQCFANLGHYNTRQDRPWRREMYARSLKTSRSLPKTGCCEKKMFWKAAVVLLSFCGIFSKASVHSFSLLALPNLRRANCQL